MLCARDTYKEFSGNIVFDHLDFKFSSHISLTITIQQMRKEFKVEIAEVNLGAILGKNSLCC